MVVPKVGTAVIGQIGNAQSDNVLVKIFRIGNKKLSGNFGGILHVSDVSDRYVDQISDVAKPGDIIRAKVISDKNQVFHLSTNDKRQLFMRFVHDAAPCLSSMAMTLNAQKTEMLKHVK